MPRIALDSLLFVALLSASGCATSSSSLKREDLDSEHAAIFGNVKIVNEGIDVTKHCYVTFTDGEDGTKSYVNVDESGYIFVTVSPGPTYLAHALCTMGEGMKTTAKFDSKDLKFDVPGDGKLAYFGHVLIDLDYHGSGIAGATGAVLGGAVGAALAVASTVENGRAKVENRFSEAQDEFKKRYGKTLGPLQPTQALAAPDRPATRLPTSQ